MWARAEKLAKEIKQVICDVVAFTLKAEPQQPQRRVCQRRIVEEEATREPITEFVSPQDYYRETVFYPSIDKIVAEIEARFDENEQELLCALKTVVMEPEKADVDADVAKVCDFYSGNDGRLLSERTIWANLVEQGARKLSNNARSSTPKFLQWIHEDGIMNILPVCFPDLAKSLGTILATSCSVERSFSTV